MGVKTAVSVAAAGVAAGLVARKLVRERKESDGDGRHPEGWKAVTVMGDADALRRGDYPEPLRRIAHVLDVRVDPAPADKGVELHARVRPDLQTADVFGDESPDQALRAALRDAKQLIETGEILRATPRPHGHRSVSLFGAAVDRAEADAKGRGVL
ncbi:hypothetical protein [Microbacterium sp. 1.5R]|uniref:hypothetical protein n=1 Tax=Microbacterium sp. 1.5R TaxID=1916917 RepID=UPI0011A2F1DE|nr:hypothetical protein [Microbacterium sp. 1.5R]